MSTPSQCALTIGIAQILSFIACHGVGALSAGNDIPDLNSSRHRNFRPMPVQFSKIFWLPTEA